jgi:hypothetical protein
VENPVRNGGGKRMAPSAFTVKFVKNASKKSIVIPLANQALYA